MKRIVSLSLITLAAFFMSGCDLVSGDDLPINLPGIELAGETNMEVLQYSEFVDPGAQILGDFELDVVIESNVDTNTLGEYAITYTISYLGIEYVVTRTISVVEELSGDTPSLTLTGDSVIEIEQYSVFEDPGVGIIGEFDLEVVVDSNVDTNTLGTYTITYTITYLEIEYSLTRTVEVVSEIVTVFPVIEIVGEALMQVENYTTFIDPGAVIVGDFELDIEVDSNVDTSILGNYTITYTITYLGIDYSVTRNVEVVMEIVIEDPTFNIYLTAGDITESSITVNLTVEDSEELISQRYVRLFKDNVEVAYLEFVVGVNTITFIDLDDNSDYKVVVSGEYQYEGSTELLYGFELQLTTLESINLFFTPSELFIELHSIEFGFTIVDEDSLITEVRVNLYKDDVLVDYIILTEEHEYIAFYELIYNTEYEIKVLFTYMTLGTTIPATSEFASITFTTLELVSDPVLSFSSLTCDLYEDEIECTYWLNSIGFNDIYMYAELYEGSTYIEDYDIWNDGYYYFYDLDAETEYTIYVYGDFTYGGVTYYDTFIGSYVYTTLEATVYYPPVIENVVLTSTATSITIEFDLTNIEESMERGRVKFLRGGSAFNIDLTEGHNSITYDYYVYENTLYSVIIEADYMGNGVYTSVYTEDIYTPPVISLVSFEQTEMFFENDYVIMKLEIDNDEDIDIDYVTINGFRYNTFVFPSDIDTLYVDMGVYSSAGNYVMNLNNVVFDLGGEEYTIDMTATDDVSINVFGVTSPSDAIVKVIDIVPQENFVTIDFDSPYQISTVVIDVYLDNPYNLPVSSITVGGVTYTGGDLTVLGYYHVQFTAEFSYQDSPSNNTLYFGSIMFERNGSIVVDNQASHVDVDVYRIYDFDNDDNTPSLIHISTPEDLMAIESDSVSPSTVFRLDNDIDMTGYNFIPIGTYENHFTGAFDGNGYTISNITINKTFGVDNGTDYVGMFGYSNGRVYDLTLTNVTIDVTTTDDNYLYVGILAGLQTTDVQNVHVYNSSITIDGLVAGTVGGLTGQHHGNMIGSSADTDIILTETSSATTSSRLYVGGLIGIKAYEDVRNSFATGDITITSDTLRTVFTGGLVGHMYGGYSYGSNYIMNSYATGDISVTTDYYGRTGGLIGEVYFQSYSYIYNSYASGDVHANAGTIGGLVGQTPSYVISSFATGNVNGTNGTISGLFGIGNNYRLTNIYRYDEQIVTRDGSPIGGSDSLFFPNIGTASSEQFNDADYYVDFLGWNTHFFSFNSLDVDGKILPVLN